VTVCWKSLLRKWWNEAITKMVAWSHNSFLQITFQIPQLINSQIKAIKNLDVEKYED